MLRAEGGGGEVQLEESLWGVRDPLSAGEREAEKDVEQLGCTKVRGRRASSDQHSPFFCLLLHREQVQPAAYPEAVLWT